MLIFSVNTLLSASFSLAVKPFNSKLLNFIDIFNEISLLTCSYFLMIFNPIIEPDVRYEVGWYFVGLIVITIIVNFVLILGKSIYENFQRVKSLIKRCKEKRKAKL